MPTLTVSHCSLPFSTLTLKNIYLPWARVFLLKYDPIPQPCDLLSFPVEGISPPIWKAPSLRLGHLGPILSDWHYLFYTRRNRDPAGPRLSGAWPIILCNTVPSCFPNALVQAGRRAQVGIHTPQSLPPTPVISGTQGRGGHTELLIGMGGDREKGGRKKAQENGGRKRRRKETDRDPRTARGGRHGVYHSVVPQGNAADLAGGRVPCREGLPLAPPAPSRVPGWHVVGAWHVLTCLKE